VTTPGFIPNTSSAREIVVTTSAYGAALVRERGQAFFAPIAASGGASGLEIRRELLLDREFRALPKLGASVRGAGLFSVYSAPVELFAESGGINAAEVRQALDEAAALAPRMIKLPLGHFRGALPPELATLLAGAPSRVVIENDQTTHGGTLEPLRDFFAAVERAGLPVGMTFDVGNWSWVGSGGDAAAAAEILAPFVEYIHLKTAQKQGDALVAVPVADDDPGWQRIVARFRPGLPLGIEFPLTGEDLSGVTRQHVERLQRAGVT
jgi:hypothetical protein